MIVLSTRAKEAIKTALAMVIVYAIALGMGWENPHWAGFAVAMISLSTAGQSMQKGVLRMLGTLVAAAVALTLIALFAQDRWWFMAALTVYLAVCTYMLTGKTRQYFWHVSGFVCLIIAVGAGPTAESAFHTAVLRTQETGMGILVYSLISVFLWPQSSGRALDTVTARLLDIQHQLFQAYSGQINTTDATDDPRALRMQQAQLLNQFAMTLNGAEADTYEVYETRAQWHEFRQLSMDLSEALERWRETAPEIQQLELSSLIPNLATVCSEIDARFVEIKRVLAGEAPADKLRDIKIELDAIELRALSNVQIAALASFKSQIEKIDALTRAVLTGVSTIKGYAQEPATRSKRTRQRIDLALDPDRMLAVFRVVTTLWVAFLIWVYVDPPGHAGFVQLAAIIAMATAMMPQIRPISMVLPFALGSVFAGVLYVFVMPQLSGFAQLAIMLFGVTFGIYYLFSEPRQALAKLAAIIPFLVLTSIQNEQTYNFAGFANSAAMIILGILLVVAMTYLPPSPRPEKMFLRLLKRFFRRADLMLTRLSPDLKRESGWGERLEMSFYQNDLLELPDKLALYGGQIDHRIFPANSPEQVQAIVNGTRILAKRLKMLEEARQYPQSELLVRELRDDIGSLRSEIKRECRQWALDPERAARKPAQDLEDRVAVRLDRVDARVNEVFGQAGEGTLMAADYENFYRYLGGLRGVSEAGIDYARLAAGIDWAHWKEARF